MTANKKHASQSVGRRLVAVIAILIALFLAMRFLPVQEWLRRFNSWVAEMGTTGILIFIGVYAVATVLLAPGSILTIGAGFAFGLWKGFLAVCVGELDWHDARHISLCLHRRRRESRGFSYGRRRSGET